MPRAISVSADAGSAEVPSGRGVGGEDAARPDPARASRRSVLRGRGIVAVSWLRASFVRSPFSEEPFCWLDRRHGRDREAGRGRRLDPDSRDAHDPPIIIATHRAPHPVWARSRSLASRGRRGQTGWRYPGRRPAWILDRSSHRPAHACIRPGSRRGPDAVGGPAFSRGRTMRGRIVAQLVLAVAAAGCGRGDPPARKLVRSRTAG